MSSEPTPIIVSRPADGQQPIQAPIALTAVPLAIAFTLG
jgi:hypothetical protein